MPNLVQLSNELEYVPKEQLAQMSQDPNNRFPQYLILSEIQRRTANEKAYAAAAQPQPTTTVAEEVVGEFMQPKGLQAGMPSVSAPTDSFSTEPMGMPASAPMQPPMQQPMMMAAGGNTKAEAREGISNIMSDINKKRSEAGLSGLMDAAGDVASVASAVIPINAAGKLRIIEKAIKPLFGSYKKALEASRKGNVDYAQLDPLVKAQAKKYIQLNKEADKLDFTTMGGVGTTVGLGIANQAGKFEYKDENKKANGGLTAYANTGQTALQQTFNNPFAAMSNAEEEIKLFGRELTPEERLKVAEEKAIVKEKQLSLGKGISDYFTQQEANIEMRRLAQEDRMAETRATNKLPRVLRNDIDTSSVMPSSIEAQNEQQLLRESTTRGTQINTGLPAGTMTTGNNLPPATSLQLQGGASITNAPPSAPASAPESDINKILRLSENLNIGEVPNISYKPTEIPESMKTTLPELPTELKDFKLPTREYNAPTEQDRQRELDVYGLGSLAKAFGSAKNLGEAGAMLGESALGLTAIKKEQRREIDRIESLKRADKAQDFQVAGTKYGLESGIRKEQFSIDKAIIDIQQSDNQNEFNANLNLAKYDNELQGSRLTIAQSLVNMEVLRDQVEATQNKTLGSLYKTISDELSNLEVNDFSDFDKETGRPKSAKGRRFVELNQDLKDILNSLKTKGMFQETKPLYQGTN